MRNCWKNHSYDYTNLCRQSDVSSILYWTYVLSEFDKESESQVNWIPYVRHLGGSLVALAQLHSLDGSSSVTYLQPSSNMPPYQDVTTGKTTALTRRTFVGP